MTQMSPKRKPADCKVEAKSGDSAERPLHRILLVEDEALIADVIAEILTESGYAVHAVANATDALAHLSNGEGVDLLFTDINLPGEIDGVALAEQARVLHPKLPVLFASGRWWRLDELQALPNAATLRKPYSPARACEAVETLLAAQAADETAEETLPKAAALV